MVEKQIVLHTGRYTVKDEDGIEEISVGEPTFQAGKWLACAHGLC